MLERDASGDGFLLRLPVAAVVSVRMFTEMAVTRK